MQKDLFQIKAKKGLGQNFLIDKNIINKIVNSLNINSKSNIIEIGPGTGALTTEIYKLNKNLIAIEIDKELMPILKSKMPDLNIYNYDFLEFDIKKILNKKNYIFVSNLPYYISTPIIFKAISISNFKTLNIMLQKELAQRIISKHGNKTYGRISVMIQTFFEIKNKIEVSRNCFEPIPNVDSTFINLERKKTDIDFLRYESFIQKCFAHKRKTLLNSLKIEKFNKIDLVEKWIQKNNLNKLIRAEELDLNSFIFLYKLVL